METFYHTFKHGTMVVEYSFTHESETFKTTQIFLVDCRKLKDKWLKRPKESFVVPTGYNAVFDAYTYAVRSKSEPNKSHIVLERRGFYRCGCLGYAHQRKCRHVRLVMAFEKSLLTVKHIESYPLTTSFFA